MSKEIGVRTPNFEQGKVTGLLIEVQADG